MTDGPSLEGLLHLGAMAVIVTAGYLGVDRLHSERETLRDELAKISGRVKASLDGVRDQLAKLGTETEAGSVYLPRPLCIQPTYFLCYVVDMPVTAESKWFHNWCCVRNILYRNSRAPCLKLFTTGRDRVVVSILCLLSTFFFLGLTFLTVQHHYIETIRVLVPRYTFLTAHNVAVGLWGLFAAALLWVLITAAAATTRLRRLDAICVTEETKLGVVLGTYVVREVERAERTVRAFSKNTPPTAG